MACSRYVCRHISLLIPADDSRLINEKNSPCSRLHQHTFSHKCSKTSIRVTALPYCAMNLWYDHSWTDLSNKLLFHVFVKPVDYIVIRSDGGGCKVQPMQFVYFIEKFAYISTVVASAYASEGIISVTCEQGKKGLNFATDLEVNGCTCRSPSQKLTYRRNRHTCVFLLTNLQSVVKQSSHNSD